MEKALIGLGVALAIAAVVYGVFYLIASLQSRRVAQHRRSIARYLEGRGEELIDARWTPLGPGAQSSNEIQFEVRYRAADGVEHAARCRVGAAGVYFTDDEAER